jgi:hypothetical protein
LFAKGNMDAKIATINNLIGVPDAPIPSAMAGTPQADAYVQSKKQKDALMGVAAFSLSSIAANNETYNPAMDARIAQYYGPGAASWAQAVTGQTARGIEADLVRMEAISLAQSVARLKSSLRMEANAGALLETVNQAQNSSAVHEAERKLISQRATVKVQ